MRRMIALTVALTFVAGTALAAEKPAPSAKKPAAATEKPAPTPAKKPAPPPIPLHCIEGTSGIFITPTAYIANPPHLHKWFGMPSVSTTYVKLGHKDIRATAVTWALHERLELGYAYERLDLGHWDTDMEGALLVGITDNESELHNFNLRFMPIKEGQWDLKWLPAITLGLHYKYNDDVKDIDRDTGGVLRSLGVRNNDGWDLTAMASKTFVGILPKPFILSAGLRSTRAAYTGFVGFTGDRDINVEANAAFFITDKLLFAAEYRQKRSNLAGVRRLAEKEDDWWLLALVYVFNEHWTATLGYLHAGDLLNHKNVGGYGLQMKWEF